MGRGGDKAIDNKSIFYGPSSRANKLNKIYRGLPRLQMDLLATESEDYPQTLEDIQAVVDRMTGWDKIDPTWYAEVNDPDSERYLSTRSNVDRARSEKQWRDDTQRRWKIGIINHHQEGLVWCAYNQPHQVIGQSHSGSGETVRVGKYLGDLVGEIADTTYHLNPHKNDPDSCPPGLEDWWAENKTQERYPSEESIKLGKRS